MTRNSAFSPAPQLNERLAALMTGAPGALQLTVVRNDHAMLLSVAGEIDAANADEWGSALAEVAAAAPGLLLIDARELDFMGSVAFAALAKQAYQCRADGIDLRMISAQPVVTRVIMLCGWQDAIPAYRSVDAALEAPRESSVVA